MRSSLDCIPCIIKQALDSSRMLTVDENKIHRVVKSVLSAAAEFDVLRTPPELGQIVHRIIRRELDNPDPYFELKNKSTDEALRLVPSVERKILTSGNPFNTALRFSIAGNIMDFGMRSTWDSTKVDESFAKAETVPLDERMVQSLYNEISSAEIVLVIGDNAGETVFDSLFIKSFPGSAKVYYGVKGSAVINDATESDAKAAGLDMVAEILPSGADAQGTLLDQCSDDFLKVFNKADVVIAKGQGNFETLGSVSRNIYFLFQVKCQVIAEHYGLTHGNWFVSNTNETGEL